jgi:hypothetical protein
LSIFADRITGEKFPDARTMIARYLEHLARATGQPSLVLDDEGHIDIPIGSVRVGVNVLEAHGVLMIFSAVMDVPITGREAFYRKLLDMSFVATEDAAFAIDGHKVVLRCLRRLSALDYEEFEDLVLTVGRVADHWDDKLLAHFG